MRTNGQHARILLSDLSDLGYEVGTGSVIVGDDSVRLALAKNRGQGYNNAQVDDYHTDGVMRWRAPVQMTVRARFSHPQAMLRGTAGFGFWNDPFAMTKTGQRGSWLPRVHMPQVAWYFFASPPSDMALAYNVSGYGWKAATMDTGRILAKTLLPFAPLGMLACRSQEGYRRLWPLCQRVLKIEEALLPTTMDRWHEYRLQWEPQQVRCVVDGVELLRTRYAPHGPLGFVAWVDNQFMVATPQGRVRNGVIANEEQWMEIASVEVTAG